MLARLAALGRLAAGVNTRYAWAMLQLKTQGETSSLAVTDGKRLVVATWPGKEIEEGKTVLIPASTLKRAAGMATVQIPPGLSRREARAKRKAGAALGTAESNGHAVLTVKGDHHTARIECDGEGLHFPHWEDIVPGGNPVFSIRVSADLLAETLKAMADATGRCTVCLEFTAPTKPIKITTVGDTEICAVGVVMPCT